MDASSCLFFSFLMHKYIDIYVQFVGTKKSETKKDATRDGWNMIREWKTWGTKRQNIVFPFFSGTTMARQGGDGVFRKNTSAPAHGCRCCIFFPRVPLFFIAFFSLRKARAADWLRNFETKTLIRSEIESTSQFPVSFFLFSLFLRQKSSEIESNRKEGKNYPFQKFIFEFHYSQRLKKKSYVRRINYRSIN